MFTRTTERRLLQAAILLGCLIPIAGGLIGVALGSQWLHAGSAVTLDSHVRYLSGLLLAIGCAYALTVPAIEHRSQTFSLLSAIVVTGGVARLLGVVVDGWPEPMMRFALVMELGVVPVLWMWQRRIAALFAVPQP